MKRILIVLAVLLTFIPCVAKADMGAPEIMGYYVTPRSMDGANYYEYDSGKEKYVVAGKIEYGKKVYVNFEDSSYGELMGSIEINDEYYNIYLKDFLTVNNEYKPNLKDEDTEKVDYLLTVLNKDGIKMYKGPSKAYSTIEGKIPYMTELRITYNNGDIWAYTEYNGNKGWVCVYGGDLGNYYKTSSPSLITASSIGLYDSPDVFGEGESNLLVTIPAGEKFFEYYALDEWTWDYYVEYNGHKGYVSTEYVMTFSDVLYQIKENIATSSTKIYASVDDDAKVIGTLKPMEEFYILGSVGRKSDYLYIEYNNLKGYISYFGEEEEDGFYIISDDDEYFYDLVNGEMTLDEYESLDDDDYEDNEDPDIEDDPSIEEDEEQDTDEDKEVEPGIGTDDKTSTNNSTKKEKGVKISSTDLVLLCVCGALVIALTAVVTIVLVNKKKVAKTEVVAPTPVVESVPVSTETPNTEVVETKVEENQETENKEIS